MMKTTLTKLKKAYSTLSYAPRVLGLETNGKFYKLIVSLLRRADKRSNPGKTEEEECHRGALMLEPSHPATVFVKGLSKPDAKQKSTFLTPYAVDNKQREKSTLSSKDKDKSKQDDLNNPVCNLQEATETQVYVADTETHRQETVSDKTEKIDPPNSLVNAIPDIHLDKNCEECPDGKTINTVRANVSDILNSERSPYIQSRFYDSDNDPSALKFFASYDKTKNPSSTETNITLDELAKHCLDSPNNKIDENLLKEMKKLGVPQTSPNNENSVIEDDIIQMDVLRKPRKPTVKTEIDVETRKCEHPPINYSDERRLEFEPTAEEGLLGPTQKNKNDTLVNASRYCKVKFLDGDKPLLNPFDKNISELDDDERDDVKYENNNYYYTRAPGPEQLENNNDLANSRNYNEFDRLSENTEAEANEKIGSSKPLENLSNPPKLSIKSEYNEKNANKSDQDPIEPSEDKVHNVTMSCGGPALPIKQTNTVDYQPKAEHLLLHQDTPSVMDEPHQRYNLVGDRISHTEKMYRALNTANPIFQAEGEMSYPNEQSGIGVTQMKRKLENVYRDPVPKKPEPLLIFNPPEHGSVKSKTNQIQSLRENEDLGPDRDLAFIHNLSSLRIRCNILPMKDTDEKATISLMVEIDAYKHPKREFAPQPDVTYTEDSTDFQKQADGTIVYQKKMDHITRDKVTLILPEKQETTYQGQVAPSPSLLEENPEISISEKPEIRISEKPDIRISENPEILISLKPEIPLSEKPEILLPKKPEILLSEKPEIPLSEKSEISLSEKPEVQLSEKPEMQLSEKPEMQLSEKREMQLSEKPEMQLSEIPEVQLSEKPEMQLSVKPEIPLSEKPEIPLSEKPEIPLSEKPEIPLSEMLKRVRMRNRAEYCQQLEQTLEHELDTDVETITGRCGDRKKPSCPPCPPKKTRTSCPPCPPKKRTRSPCRGPQKPACPRPCKPAGPPPCPSPCPKKRSSCSSRSSRCGRKAGNPCCPGAGSGQKGGNPCCPGAGSGRSGGNPCCPGASNKFASLLPSLMMNSIVSLVEQRLTTQESELAQNRISMITKDAYQRFLYSACFAELFRPHLLPILNICGMEPSSGKYESMNCSLARDYDPWVPIPCWPVTKKKVMKPLVCPKEGCQIPLPGKNRPPCNPYPCKGFPKRKNSFSIIDLYACWSNPNGRN